MAQENRRVTDIKIFDNTTQSESKLCSDNQCPALKLATPNGCVCACANGFSLNASGMKCLPHTKTVSSNECGLGL